MLLTNYYLFLVQEGVGSWQEVEGSWRGRQTRWGAKYLVVLLERGVAYTCLSARVLHMTSSPFG